MKIKICGITNLADAHSAVESGADALGFIFAPSPRRISPEKAIEIISKLPPFVSKVGVFMNENMPLVRDIMNYCVLDWAQFHGEEDPSYLSHFAPRAIKVFHIMRKKDLNKIKAFSPPFFMLDLPKNSGIRPDWDWRIVREAKNWGKIILAGGLTPGNIENALSEVSPYGVDVCSGVEETEGIKNHARMKDFIRKVRKWQLLKS